MDAPALELFRGDDGTCATLPVRGVGWVLGWAATMVVLAAAATILIGFAYQLAAERSLAQAAAAGIREAAQPRATSTSVEAVVRRRLVYDGHLARATTMHIERNGQPLRGVIHANRGDQIAISLTTPVAAVLPRWLPVRYWLADSVVKWRSVTQISR